ncbi:unnamed protein product [Caenorhabditis bovis]|uniref:Uncharacterized protein n=1 Tax=Caenorhabditis bovis TaxID=2654633 RepID=A0A8S1EGI5_9PELO|nr:unnamed protein product [Caenorhabditis bovis]
MSDRICGCSVVTSAGVITSLQLIVLLLTLSSTGLILDRYHKWQTQYLQINSSSTEEVTISTVHKYEGTIWSEALMELGMAWYVAFGTFWLFSVLILTLSFKYYRPVFVIPNCTALLVGIFFNLFLFGILLARILDVPKDLRTDELEEAIIIYSMGLSLFAFLSCVFFLIFIIKYHNFLKKRYGHQVPKFVQSRARTGYHEDVY